MSSDASLCICLVIWSPYIREGISLAMEAIILTFFNYYGCLFVVSSNDKVLFAKNIERIVTIISIAKVVIYIFFLCLSCYSLPSALPAYLLSQLKPIWWKGLPFAKTMSCVIASFFCRSRI
jgi:hypothetical protein